MSSRDVRIVCPRPLLHHYWQIIYASLLSVVQDCDNTKELSPDYYYYLYNLYWEEAREVKISAA